MRSGPRRPRTLRWTLLLGLAGLAAAVSVSAPAGTGMQWDELVLSCIAASSAGTVFRRARAMSRAAARPWLLVGVGTCCFLIAQLLAGAFPGPAFDGFGVDGVLLLVGASTPLVSCAMLAGRVALEDLTAAEVAALLAAAPSLAR